MLRSGLLVFGLVLTGIGLVLLIMRGMQSGQPFLIWGAIVMIAVCCESWRYCRNKLSKNGQWQRTGERFEDPETGKNMEVFYDPASGDRRYIQCDDHLLPPKK